MPFGLRIAPLLTSANIDKEQIETHSVSEIPSWCIRKPIIDLSLHSEKKSELKTCILFPFSLYFIPRLFTGPLCFTGNCILRTWEIKCSLQYAESNLFLKWQCVFCIENIMENSMRETASAIKKENSSQIHPPYYYEIHDQTQNCFNNTQGYDLETLIHLPHNKIYMKNPGPKGYVCVIQYSQQFVNNTKALILQMSRHFCVSAPLKKGVTDQVTTR